MPPRTPGRFNLGTGIDGTPAAQMILAARELPVVFLSSHTEPDVVEKTEKITCFGYIVKNSGETVLATSVKMAFRLFDSRKLADDTFRRSINGLYVHRMLYDAAGEAVDCEYLKVNDAFERHTGLPAQKVVGRTIRALYSRKEAREVIDLYAGVVSSGNPVRRELYFAPIDQWFELSVFPTRDVEFTVVIQNVTAKKHSVQIVAAEREGHHPRVTTEWGGVTVEWWTHKIDGRQERPTLPSAIGVAGAGFQPARFTSSSFVPALPPHHRSSGRAVRRAG